MSNSIDVKTAHPSTPVTSDEWATFSHELSRVLSETYDVHVKPGKLLYALAKAAKFQNHHAMKTALNQFHQTLNEIYEVRYKTLKAQENKITEIKEESKLLDEVNRLHSDEITSVVKNIVFGLVHGQVDEHSDISKLAASHHFLCNRTTSKMNAYLEQTMNEHKFSEQVIILSNDMTVLKTLFPEEVKEVEGIYKGLTNEQQKKLSFKKLLTKEVIKKVVALSADHLRRYTSNMEKDELNYLLTEQSQAGLLINLFEISIERGFLEFNQGCRSRAAEVISKDN